ncbi:unnamed protein product, partial [marine sediment metagenome]
VIAENAKKWLKGTDAPLVAIEQGDFSKFCECPQCRESVKKYGHSGTLIRFVNQVAREIKKDYPDILVTTLAYQFTSHVPLDTKADENIVIRYAPIEACVYHNFRDGNYNREDFNVHGKMKGWVDISSRVWVWYYAEAQPLQIRPDMHAWSGNFKLMRDTGVRGVSTQTRVGTGKRIFLGDLRNYILARLTWDPDYDVKKGIKEFTRAVYGDAAYEMALYAQMVSDEKSYTGIYNYPKPMSRYSGFHTGAGGSTMAVFNRDKLEELDALFDRAEA